MAGNQISQLPVEILIKSDATTILKVSQLPIEIAMQSNTAKIVKLSQTAIEILANPSIIPPSTEQVQFFIVS